MYCPRANDLHPEKKHVVLDGRLRADPTGGKLFSLLFLVHSVAPDSDSASTANLEVAEAKLNISVDIEFTKAGKPKCVNTKGPTLPSICFLTNPKKIEAGTMLVALSDMRLQKLVKETADERKKDEMNNVSIGAVWRLNRCWSAC